MSLVAQLLENVGETVFFVAIRHFQTDKRLIQDSVLHPNRIKGVDIFVFVFLDTFRISGQSRKGQSSF